VPEKGRRRKLEWEMATDASIGEGTQIKAWGGFIPYLGTGTEISGLCKTGS
jgi:hypothetical protein